MKNSVGFLSGLAIISVFLYLVSPVLPPFVVGAFFAWLLDPLVQRLVSRRWPRGLAVMLVFLIFVFLVTLLLFFGIPKISAEVTRLIYLLPEFARFIQQKMPVDLANSIPMDFASLKNTLTETGWDSVKAGGVISVILKTAFHSGARLAVLLGHFILVPVVALYLLYDWNQVVSGIKHLLPRKYAPTILLLARRCDAVLAAFFRGQLLVMLTLGIIYSIGLTLLGLQLGFLIGLIIGVLAIVPYLGVTIGLVSALLAAWVQFGDWHALLSIVFFFVVVQTLDGTFITPRLVGHRIGLHPVFVIFAVLAGGALAGFTGVLVALPVAAMMRVLFDFFTSGRAAVE